MKYNDYDDNLSTEAYLTWTATWMRLVKSVLDENGNFFLNIGGSPSKPWIPFDVANEARKLGFHVQNRISWVKSVHIDAHTHGHVRPIYSSRFLIRSYAVVAGRPCCAEWLGRR
jgi:site-specific DNA-methyltransferase (adenine-specific)